MPAGRPTKYEGEKTCTLVYKLALLGATDEEMADILNVEESTVNNWKNSYPEFLESIKRGKEEADATVAQKLYHRAIGYEHPETITASYQGEITDTKEVIKHYPPDPTAAIFWLKNRQSRKWRDKQEIETNVTVKGKLEQLSDEELQERLNQLKGKTD
jgi:transposase